MKQRELRQTTDTAGRSVTAQPRRRRAAKVTEQQAVQPRRTATPTGGEKGHLVVHIRVFGTPVSPESRQRMRQKVDRRFRKFAGSIERISIRLTDVNGPKGGVDKACRMKAVLRNLPSAVFKHQAASLDLAFSGALSGAERSVRRSLHRRRTKPIKKRPRLAA